MSVEKGDKVITMATHNSRFHADDLFAVSMLVLHLQKNDPGSQIAVVRTRDPKVIDAADFVVDVGGVHDPEKRRFDHHQKGGAGQRDNGIPHAALSLVWNEYGMNLCDEDKDVWQNIYDRVLQSIDAYDNGVSLEDHSEYADVPRYYIHALVQSFNPTWNDPDIYDERFQEALDVFVPLLEREIANAKSYVDAKRAVIEAVTNEENIVDKHILVLDEKYPYDEVLEDYVDIWYVIRPDGGSGDWRITTVRDHSKTFINRKDLPAAWAGHRDGELATVTGIEDAIFCHLGLFIASAKTREAAIALAQLAVAA